MTKTLLLMRHAKSSWDDPDLKDHDRPLNKRGRRGATAMGQLIAREAFPIEQILCSTSVRTRETIDRVFRELTQRPKVEYRSELYCASANQIVEVLRHIEQDPQYLMVIAHNPGLEDLLAQLTGELQHFPTAALALIELPIERWDELDHESKGQMKHLWRPRDLDQKST